MGARTGQTMQFDQSQFASYCIREQSNALAFVVSSHLCRLSGKKLPFLGRISNFETPAGFADSKTVLRRVL
jgi:hypothetical protein